MYTDMLWSDEQETKLRKFWDEGLSASKIGARLGFTRSAVCGKARRMKLPFRMSGGADTAVTNRVAARTKAKAKAKPAAPKPPSYAIRKFRPASMLPTEPPIPSHQYDVARIATADLEPHHCKWPVGDPGASGFGHCGCKRAKGLPYCAQHAARAYSPEGAPRPSNTGWKPRTSGVLLRRITSSVNLFEDA